MNNKKTTETIKVKIRGLVQGVGIRPFIYRLAKKHNIKGSVENNNEGVIIIAKAYLSALHSFLDDIANLAPEAAEIKEITSHSVQCKTSDDFIIKKSSDSSAEVTEVSPDIAVCIDCLEDMQNQEHRKHYPLINCTNCGPRFTIIRALPYDRPNTTMKDFPLCPRCQKEYNNILDRRFHAQPVACHHCGPHYTMHVNGKQLQDIDNILEKTATFLREGKIIAIKGLGGFHLACQASDDSAAEKLRTVKSREGKPFACMFPSLENIEEIAYLSTKERKLIASAKRPVVLLNLKKPLFYAATRGLNSIGIMLPYMPFHHMLMDTLQKPIVLTSGNISDEPIIIDNKQALKTFSPQTDAVITYNRDIHNRTDDSVCFISNNKSRIIRRSRSFSPSPISLPFNTEGILACGAELKNTFCIGKNTQAIISQHIGDLKNLETFEFYKESIERHRQLFRFVPCLLAHDLHPDYLSTKHAINSEIENTGIQHHHAHIASVMAEHLLDKKVIGISFDGTGYGTDGNIWGSEYFVCDATDFKRRFHFEYMPMPGGDLAAKEIWRMGASYVYRFLGEELFDLDIPFVQNLDKAKLRLILEMIDKNINSPLSAGCGRLFDAVAAIMNCCQNNTYEAEAPMILQSHIDSDITDNYPLEFRKNIISWQAMLAALIKDIQNKKTLAEMSTKFHNSIISAIFEGAKIMRKEENIRDVILSGGSFQNPYILENTEKKLTEAGFNVYSNSLCPTNDGGISLGQLYITAKRRSLCV